MPRNDLLMITPHLVVERARLAAAVMAAASECGLAVRDYRRENDGPRSACAEVALGGVQLAAAGHQRPLGVMAENGATRFAFLVATDDSCVVRASAPGRQPSDLAAAAFALGKCVFQQLVIRAVQTALRANGYAIIERSASPHRVFTLRARLPRPQQVRPSARTAPPEMAVHVDARGGVCLLLEKVPPSGRDALETLLTSILAAGSTGNLRSCQFADNATKRPAPPLHRPRSRIHAA